MTSKTAAKEATRRAMGVDYFAQAKLAADDARHAALRAIRIAKAA